MAVAALTFRAWAEHDTSRPPATTCCQQVLKEAGRSASEQVTNNQAMSSMPRVIMAWPTTHKAAQQWPHLCAATRLTPRRNHKMYKPIPDLVLLNKTPK